MKPSRLKVISLAIITCLLVVGMFILAGCAGRGSLSSDIIDETGAYKVTADDAGKGSAVMASGGVTVKEGQIVVVSPDLQKGSLQLKLIDSSNKTVFDEKITGRVLDTHEFDFGEYAISVTCNEDGTTGTLLVVAVDAAEFEKQNQDLEAALAEAAKTVSEASTASK